ncbi:MAG TPA: ABC transporter substrate-binding protein [Casimicrobiaceae bacterium]|nr:ABC transporter substrate-binding protein [Casimicrobiaceae bacterium]
MQRIRLIVFPGGFNWPIWVAQARGLFARESLDVEVTHTPGSVYQLSGLIEQRFDLAITLIDNVIAYRSGQGEAPLVGRDLCAFMAADTRVLPTLVTQPGIRRYADLRGRTLSVDALTTGYAFVLLAMLEHGGLTPADYQLERVGGAEERYRAMQAGRHAGCLLNSPFERLLEAQGFTLLDHAADALGRYQGQVLAGRRQWAEANAQATTGFIRAFLIAVKWLYDPAHQAEAFDIFRRQMPSASNDAPSTAWRVLFDAELGFPRNGEIDTAALDTVIELRQKYGAPPVVLGPARDYYDSAYLDAARRQLGEVR